jgi:hypothetical protein
MVRELGREYELPVFDLHAFLLEVVGYSGKGPQPGAMDSEDNLEKVTDDGMYHTTPRLLYESLTGRLPP